MNVPGGYTCECLEGFRGDGRSCIGRLSQRYYDPRCSLINILQRWADTRLSIILYIW